VDLKRFTAETAVPFDAQSGAEAAGLLLHSTVAGACKRGPARRSVLYAVKNGAAADNYADFDSFTVTNQD
jgi:hypothetical protein